MGHTAVKKVFVVFKTHFDIGFTHLAGEVVDWYGKGMIEDALRVCRATREAPEGHKYVWTVPSWPLQKTLEGISDPALLAETEDFIRGGQLVWHGLPFTTHTEVCGLEDFCRGMLIATRLGKRFGRQTHDAKMTDVPGHTWMLPSLLSAAGIRFLHLGNNACATPPSLPRLFWWEGPDGSRLLTYYSKGGYGSDLIPPDDWEYPYWLAMLQTADNTGAQDASYLDGLFQRAARELPGTEISVGTLEDFGNAMLASGAEIPVVRGDLADSWIRGVGSAPQGVALLRNLRSRLQATEAALTLQGGMTAANRRLLDTAYEKLLLFGEHTWSLDTKVSLLTERRYGAPWAGYQFWESGFYDHALFRQLCKTDPGYLRIQASWQEQLDYLNRAKDCMEQAAGALSSDTGDRNAFTVLSALGRPAICRVDLQGLPITDRWVADAAGSLYEITVDPAGVPGCRLPLPTQGAAAFTLVGAAPSQPAQIAWGIHGTPVLENQHLAITFHRETGTIATLVDKSTGKQWVDYSAKARFGQYRYDIYGSDELDGYLRGYLSVLRDWGVNDLGKAGYPREQQHQTFLPAHFTCQAENSISAGTIRLTADITDASSSLYGNARRLELTYTLGADDRFVDLCCRILHKQPTPFIETGHLVFPLAAQKPAYRIQKLGCVVDPAADIPADCNHNLYCMDSWTAVEEDGYGFAVIAKDMPLFSYEKPGVLAFDRRFPNPRPELWMQSFNNSWGTNFPQWSQGDIRQEYRLYPYAGSWQQAKVWELSEAFRYNPVVLPGRTACPTLLSAPLEGLSLLAVKPAEDNRGLVMRLQENTGEPGKRKLCLTRLPAAIWRCTLVEEPLEPLTAIDGSLTLELAPFQVVTLRLFQHGEMPPV